MKAPLSRDAFGNIVFFLFLLLMGSIMVNLSGEHKKFTFWILALPVIALMILRMVFFLIGYHAKGQLRKKR